MTSAGNGLKQTRDEFSEFYDQTLAQRKENMTKCSHKTEREFKLIWLAALAASQKNESNSIADWAATPEIVVCCCCVFLFVFFPHLLVASSNPGRGTLIFSFLVLSVSLLFCTCRFSAFNSFTSLYISDVKIRKLISLSTLVVISFGRALRGRRFRICLLTAAKVSKCDVIHRGQ